MKHLARLEQRAEEFDDAESWYQLGVTAGREGQRDRAIEALRTALDRGPPAILAAAIGQSLQVLGDLEQAEAALRRAVDLDPSSPDPLGHLGALLLRLGKRDPALRALSKWADLSADPVSTHYRLGSLLAARDDLGAAANHLQIAVMLDPRHLPALRALGAAHDRLGNRDACLRAWESVHRLEPGDPHAAVSYGAALSDAGRSDDAIALLSETAQRCAPFWELHLQLGRALRSAMQTGTALEHLVQAERMSPTVAAIHLEKGRTLGDLGRPAEAVAAYERALDLDPRSVQAHFELGKLLHALGRTDDASAQLVRASVLAPGDARVEAALAQVLEAKKAIAGIGGSLAVIPLPDLIQFLCSSRASGVLEIDSDRGKASIQMAAGNLCRIDTPTGSHTGEDRLVIGFIEVAEAGGAFRFSSAPIEGEGVDPRFVLMEAMRRIDETTDL
jgi:superkiller protein 3